jgi:hypothetical protein
MSRISFLASRISFMAAASVALAATFFVSVQAQDQQAAVGIERHTGHGGGDTDPSLAAQVRRATAIYRDINQAIAAGYQQFGGCVSGPEVGAMGVHFVNGALVDATLEVERPEALIYEVKGGMARLLGVEYITPAPVWDAAHPELPLLSGQHFQLLGTPNRYRLPALYELHVWAWRENPNGTYVDWNPRVSCD